MGEAWGGGSRPRRGHVSHGQEDDPVLEAAKVAPQVHRLSPASPSFQGRRHGTQEGPEEG